ncbi:MAG: lipase maturation factor family protein [Phycisphaerales bacterium]|nr:lipase maturation factor family protein [Phycisphaerales bacterium]
MLFFLAYGTILNMACGTCTSCEDGPCKGLLPETELPTNLPVVVYDGNCSFCRRWLKRYEAVCPPDRLAWCASDKAAGHYPGISEDQFGKWLHLIHPDGTHARGAEAVFEIMHRVDLRAWPLRLYQWLPPFRGLCDGVYRLIADHRGNADKAARLAWGKLEIPSTSLLTRRVFLRLLGLIYLIALLSIGHQLDGLIGEEGLQPASQWLQQVEAYYEGQNPILKLPTTLWFGGATMLEATWMAGLLASVLLIIGLVPMASAALVWLSYLSIVNGAGGFMSYQWDALLLEVGFIAIFWAPFAWRLNSPKVRRPSTLIRWMLIWLLIRFMFFSGWVKLASDDPTWASYTALDYHYWTQPLPLWTSYFAWHLPLWWHKFCCLMMFAIELGVPFLLLFPRIPRLIGFLLLVGLQLGILLTGNYGFFNLLTIVLCFVVLDDSQLLWMWPKRTRGLIRVGLAKAESIPRRWVNVVIATLLLSLTIPAAVSQGFQRNWLTSWQASASPWHVVNRYGLFAMMTTTRPEIIIEGSNDGQNWKPYLFHWKPGPLDRAPGFSQPDMPRLDWQLWFDALAYEAMLNAERLQPTNPLTSVNGTQILPRLLAALAQGREPVLGLLESAPFPSETPPDFLRWHLDSYEFTSMSEREATGNWWKAQRRFTSDPIPSAVLRLP